MTTTTNDQEAEQVLTFDAFTDILSRCSLPALAMFRTTSTNINSRTYQSYFRDLHRRRIPTVSGFFLQRQLSPNSNFLTTSFVPSSSSSSPISHMVHEDFLPVPTTDIVATRILAADRGFIVYEVEHRDHGIQYYISKPSTEQRMRLPNPDRSYTTKHMGIVVLGSGVDGSIRFKILRMCVENWWSNDREIKWEVFDSESWTWRNLLDGNPMLAEAYLEYNQPISVRGSLHWLTTDRIVIAFHGDTERWDSFAIHSHQGSSWIDFSLRLIEFEEKLGFMCMNQDTGLLDISVLEKYWERLWRTRFSIDLSSLEYWSHGHRGLPLGFCYAGDTVIMNMIKSKLVLYNVTNGATETMDSGVWEVKVFPLYSDFEPCVFRRP